jgi:hypothetical protein
VYLYSVVPETADNLLVIILKTVHSFTVLTVTLNSGESVSAILPVVLHGLGGVSGRKGKDAQSEVPRAATLGGEGGVFSMYDHSNDVFYKMLYKLRIQACYCFAS